VLLHCNVIVSSLLTTNNIVYCTVENCSIISLIFASCHHCRLAKSLLQQNLPDLCNTVVVLQTQSHTVQYFQWSENNFILSQCISLIPVLSRHEKYQIIDYWITVTYKIKNQFLEGKISNSYTTGICSKLLIMNPKGYSLESLMYHILLIFISVDNASSITYCITIITVWTATNSTL